MNEIVYFGSFVLTVLIGSVFVGLFEMFLNKRKCK